VDVEWAYKNPPADADRPADAQANGLADEGGTPTDASARTDEPANDGGAQVGAARADDSGEETWI
jgi:hypothetical protein